MSKPKSQEFTLEELLLFQKWTQERQKLASESYFKCKGDDPMREVYDGRIGVYKRLDAKIQRNLDNIET